MTFADYLYNIRCALSVLINALIGGEFGESLSARVGRSGLMRLPMPRRWREHFERAADRV